MAILRIIRAALGASATLAMLAGCSGGSSPAAFSPGGPGGRTDNSVLAPTIARIAHAPVKTPSFMDPGAAGKPLIFVSDAADGVIDIYPQSGKNQKMVGQITGLTQPQGITTDKKGDLYVANTNSSNVLVYAPDVYKRQTLPVFRSSTREYSAAGVTGIWPMPTLTKQMCIRDSVYLNRRRRQSRLVSYPCADQPRP